MCAALYLHFGHASYGMRVCEEYISTGINPEDDIQVKCTRCRVLANTGQCDKALDVLNEV